MNEGRDRGLWWHTSAVICSIANSNRDTKKRKTPYLPSEIHPWEVRAKKSKAKKSGIGILKAVFVNKDFTQVKDHL